MSDLTQSPDFDKLMQTVGVLRTHYSTLARMAEAEMLKARIRGDITSAEAYRGLLEQMSADHRTALDLIAEQITSVDELQKTRRAIRAAADEAHDFVADLKKTQLTLAKLKDAANFLTKLVAQLGSLLT